MELWQEILHGILHNELKKSDLSQFFNVGRLLESECYKALVNIKEIIENDDLDDKECFYKIEKIVCLFEKLGSNGGNRHDFG